jgi:hypothetical protein
MPTFRAGLGALVRRGTYWYPVCLIQFDENQLVWTVRWWRGCKFAEPGIELDSTTTVNLDDIVDSLWMNRTQCWAVRVSLEKKLMIMILTFVSAQKMATCL